MALGRELIADRSHDRREDPSSSQRRHRPHAEEMRAVAAHVDKRAVRGLVVEDCDEAAPRAPGDSVDFSGQLGRKAASGQEVRHPLASDLSNLQTGPRRIIIPVKEVPFPRNRRSNLDDFPPVERETSVERRSQERQTFPEPGVPSSRPSREAESFPDLRREPVERGKRDTLGENHFDGPAHDRGDGSRRQRAARISALNDESCPRATRGMDDAMEDRPRPLVVDQDDIPRSDFAAGRFDANLPAGLE